MIPPSIENMFLGYLTYYEQGIGKLIAASCYETREGVMASMESILDPYFLPELQVITLKELAAEKHGAALTVIEYCIPYLYSIIAGRSSSSGFVECSGHLRFNLS